MLERTSTSPVLRQKHSYEHVSIWCLVVIDEICGSLLLPLHRFHCVRRFKGFHQKCTSFLLYAFIQNCSATNEAYLKTNMPSTDRLINVNKIDNAQRGNATTEQKKKKTFRMEKSSIPSNFNKMY